jgi:hypothetical protein
VAVELATQRQTRERPQNQELTRISLQSPGQRAFMEKRCSVNGLQKPSKVSDRPAGKAFRLTRQELPAGRGRARTLHRRARFL